MEFGKSVSRTILAGAFAALCSIYSPSAQAAEKPGECAADPFYAAKGGVHFRRASANALLTVFEGGHDINFPAGVEFLSRQRKGAKADFTIPASANGASVELTK